jgi:hypothetical protein
MLAGNYAFWGCGSLTTNWTPQILLFRDKLRGNLGTYHRSFKPTLGIGEVPLVHGMLNRLRKLHKVLCSLWSSLIYYVRSRGIRCCGLRLHNASPTRLSPARRHHNLAFTKLPHEREATLH